MPAPPGPAIQGNIMSAVTFPLGKALPPYIQLLATNTGTAWQLWLTGLLWGNVTVVGAGIGAWTGVGSGGSIIEASPLDIPYVPFQKATKYDEAFQKGMAKAVKSAFSTWASSYKFAGLQFTGASGATPLTPGPIIANNIPSPLQSAGVGVTPMDSLIVEMWKPDLIAAGMNLFQKDVKTVDLMKAVAKGIVQTFSTTFLTSAMVSGGIALGVAAPPAGLGNATSLPVGTIV